jgi:hypothetical protein
MQKKPIDCWHELLACIVIEWFYNIQASEPEPFKAGNRIQEQNKAENIQQLI